ncbi:uncharacterized protein PgNI_01069 [Pyricularia grisea]|uniref:Uncharacterized protein n=1 Tax=Pyricularia grisea TaxID=148305 RepID=A0A6P8BGP7_PYRGI|nr:uncharacterized protein PgNI_01069 [Pyricularia grisea]TLD15827.1 hypothetical protein PgNI_01069 [Pyricularia grisea]
MAVGDARMIKTGGIAEYGRDSIFEWLLAEFLPPLMPLLVVVVGVILVGPEGIGSEDRGFGNDAIALLDAGR